MKRLFILVALLCSPFAWGTAYTSAATGNWNNSSTWSPAGVPGSGDSVTLANTFTVTVPVSYTAIASSISCSSATGTGTLVINGTLEYQGATLNECSGTPWICNSCTLTADDASTNIVWNTGYANCSSSCALLEWLGTSSSPFTVNGTAGSTWSFGGGSYQGSGMILATWGSVSGCGTASVPCIYPQFFGSAGLSTSITHVTFTSTGDVTPYLYGTGSSFVWANNSFITPINSNGRSIDFSVQGGITGDTCTFTNSYLEGTFKESSDTSGDYGSDDTCNVSWNVMLGTSTTPPYSGVSVGHGTNHFDGNILYNQLAASAGSDLPAGSITRIVFLLANNTTTQHLVCGGLNTYAPTTINGMTYERQFNDGSGLQGTDSCLLPPPGGAASQAITVENVVAIPAPNGFSPAQLVNMVGACSPNCPVITAVHNTVLATPSSTSSGFAAFSGEGSTAQAGLYAKIADNICWLSSSAAGFCTGWFNSETPVNDTFGNVGNDDNYNITGSAYSSIYYGSSSWYSITPGSYGNGDITANPNFQGCYNGSTTAVGNCTFSSWGTVQGISVSSWTDIMNQFKIMNSASPGAVNNASTLAYYYWTRQGFTPLNTALHGTASDGGDIGAVSYLAPTPPLFAGLLTSTTDVTTSPSWTTPSVPASNAYYTDSIFGINAYRIQAVTGSCPVNGTYNPTGDCSITNTQMQVDYAKTVPWSVNDNYYIATSNEWLFLYSRPSAGVYNFIQTLRTYETSYGSTRDYGNSDSNYYGLIGDFSNWLWANNSSSSPNVIYYTGSTIASPNRTQLKAYHADTDTITVVHDFAPTIATVNGWGTCGRTATAIDMQREGNQSDSDRYWAFGVTDGSSSGWCAALVYDKTTDTVIALQSFGANGMCGVPACATLQPGYGYPNWIGMSPSGTYVIVNWQNGSDDASWSRGEGTEIYTNTLGYLGVATSYDGHGDAGYDTNGLEVYVDKDSSGLPNGVYSFEICYLGAVNMNPGPTGCRRYLSIPSSWNTSPPNTFFISMRGTHGAGLGQMALSTQTGGGTGWNSSKGNGGWGALEDDFVRMDWASGSMNVASGVPPAAVVTRFGRNHAIYPIDSGGDGDYGSQANWSVDRDSSKGAWTSNFDVVPTYSCTTNSANCNYYSMYAELGSSPPPPSTVAAPQWLLGTP